MLEPSLKSITDSFTVPSLLQIFTTPRKGQGSLYEILVSKYIFSSKINLKFKAGSANKLHLPAIKITDSYKICFLVILSKNSVTFKKQALYRRVSFSKSALFSLLSSDSSHETEKYIFLPSEILFIFKINS